jgi:hypothetical protein
MINNKVFNKMVDRLVCGDKFLKQILILALVMAFHFRSGAQELTSKKRRWSIAGEVLTQTPGAFSESLRLPGLTRQLSDGKGFQVGLEYVWNDTGKGQLFQSLTWIEYWNPDKETGTSAATWLGYRLTIRKGYIEGLAGGGYWYNAFFNDKVLQDVNGGFYKERNAVASPVFSAGLGAGYSVRPLWDIYTRYTHHAQFPADMQPFRLHRALNLGVRVKL